MKESQAMGYRTFLGLPIKTAIAAITAIILGFLLIYTLIEIDAAYGSGFGSTGSTERVFIPIVVIPPIFLTISAALLIYLRNRWAWLLCISFLIANLVIGLNWITYQTTLISRYGGFKIYTCYEGYGIIGYSFLVTLCFIVLALFLIDGKRYWSASTEYHLKEVEKTRKRPRSFFNALGIGIAALVVDIVIIATTSSGWSYYEYWDYPSGIKPQIQNSVTAFMIDNNGSLPTGVTASIGTYNVTAQDGTNIGPCEIIDMCQIVEEEGELMRTVPDTCARFNGSNNDNFDDPACDLSPPEEGHHYVYVMDSNGNVYSVCDVNNDGMISEDGIENVDGYHGEYNENCESIWP